MLKPRSEAVDHEHVRFVSYSFALLALAAVGAVLLARGGSQPARAGVAAAGASIRVTERDFRISAPKSVATGDLSLTVANKGPDDHELIVVRTTKGRLPLRSDGLTVDEAKLKPVTQPGLEPGAPDSVRTLRLHLPPGRYVFFCNMAGHYMAGMHATLVVR
jgi:uncharacterized cupredoxin-like copper-binding protein